MWQQLAERLGSKLKMAATSHPQSDGQSKRTIRNLSQYLRAFVSNSGRNWQDALGFAGFAYNDSVNTTGFSPFQLLLGQDPTMPWQLIVPGQSQREEVRKLCDRMTSNVAKALAALERARMRSVKQVNLKRRPGGYNIRDQVYINTRLFRDKLPGVNRLKPNLVGPFRAVKELNNSYEVDLGESGLGMRPVFNTSELKRAPISEGA